MKLALACRGFNVSTPDLIWKFIKAIDIGITVREIDLKSVPSRQALMQEFNSVFCVNQEDMLNRLKQSAGFASLSEYRDPRNFEHICSLVQDFSQSRKPPSFNVTMAGRICSEVLETIDLNIERTLRYAFEYAENNATPLLSVDLACSLSTEVFWRQCCAEVRADYPSVAFWDISLPEIEKFLLQNKAQVIVASKLCGEAIDSILAHNIKSSFTLNDKNFGIYECKLSMDTPLKTEVISVLQLFCRLLATTFNFSAMAKRFSEKLLLAHNDTSLVSADDIIRFVALGR